jgi:hypothetical protein
MEIWSLLNGTDGFLINMIKSQFLKAQIIMIRFSKKLMIGIIRILLSKDMCLDKLFQVRELYNTMKIVKTNTQDNGISPELKDSDR